MLSNGLWSIDLASDQLTLGSGVVVLIGSQILGGDAAYLYTGTMELHDDEIEARVNIKHYGNLPPWTIFNVSATEFNLLARGKFETPDELWLVGNVTEDLAREIAIRMTFRHRAF